MRRHRLTPPPLNRLVRERMRSSATSAARSAGTTKKCNGCMQRTHCSKRCQKKDWKTVHREQCEKLLQFVCHRWLGGASEGGGGGGAAAAVGEGVTADDDEFAHPCPVCLEQRG